MGSYYRILGAKVPSWALSMGTIGGAVAIAVFPRGGDAAAAPAAEAPVPAAKSDDFDVEKLLNDFLKDEKK